MTVVDSLLAAPSTTNPGASALERVRGVAMALGVAELARFNLDVNHAETKLAPRLEDLRGLRAAILRELPHFDVRNLDELEHLLRAVAYAYACWVGMSTSPEDAAALRAEALAVRSELLTDARALVSHNLLEPGLLEGVKGGAGGDRDLAGDLRVLHAALHANLSRIAGKTAVTEERVEHAFELSTRLLLLAGEREREVTERSVQTQALAELRDRVFTLFQRAYDQVRRAVTYLRWEQGDAEHFAPSLYARNPGRARRNEEPAAPTAPTAPAAPPAGGLLSLSNPASGLTVPPGEPFTR